MEEVQISSIDKTAPPAKSDFQYYKRSSLMSVILEKFLIKNNYTNFNRKDISLQLQTHPKNPSFRAITDTLDYFGIENVAAIVPEDSLPSMPANFLTLIDHNEPQLVLVVKKENFVYCYSENEKREKYSFSEFNKIWSKKVIAIGENSKNDTNAKKLNLIGGLLAIGSLVLYLSLSGVTWTTSFVLLLSSIGLYLSLLLVKEKIGYHSAWVHSICTTITNSNCDEVINSKGGMLTKNISLVDAGFLYFSILVFQSIFFGYNSITALAILLSIPIIVFSIYYQAIVLKKWCLLCLGVAAVLSLLNILSFGHQPFKFNILQVTEILMTMSVLIPAYFNVKNLIVTQKKYEDKLFAASQFKRNPEIIKNLMNDASMVHDLGMMQNEIRFGNPEAMHKIIAFTNPFCGFCKAAFESYVKITKAHPDVEIWLRFNSDFENFDSASTKICVRLVELYFEEGRERFIKAYFNWFEERNEKDWLKKNGISKFEEKTISLLKSHRNWAIKNNIDHTPATIIGGQVFPSYYGYEDLTLVLSDILETQKT